MKVDQKGHTTTIKNTQFKTAEFITKLTHEYNSFKNQNLIIDLSTDKEIVMEDVKSFSELIKKHKKNKKSFVLVLGPHLEMDKFIRAQVKCMVPMRKC